MRYLMCVSLVSALALMQPVFGSGGDPRLERQKEEVVACLRAIEAAAERLDVDAIFERVLDNQQGALVQNGRILLTREDALASTRAGFAGLRKASYIIGQEHVTLLAADLALVVSDGQSQFEAEDGRGFSLAYAQTVLLQRVGGTWKVLHAHRSFPVQL